MNGSEIKIRNLFTRDIERELNGVIKVDQEDEENVFVELDEYVITKETLRNIDKFFSGYDKAIEGPTDKMGIWVSGFFGSGKSHFIKMLAYLLENRVVKGKSALEFFREKIDDALLFDRIEKVVNHGTRDVILFNIEVKADSMTENEMLVNILMRAFNEKQGLFGGVFWIADMERELQKKGLYGKFKNEFQGINGNEWEEERDAYTFVQDDIIEALAKCDFTSREAATRIFETDGKGYIFSVEDFTKKVKQYCDDRGDDHQVVFLIDEIGQYIGDNSKLMLNLQSIVEELGKELQGKAWIVVTSQADIDTALKKMVIERDFSKIQGRFYPPLSLSSANVDEVIKRRLLEKKDEYRETLSSYYTEKRTVLRNLISFSRTGPEMKTYRSEEDFVDTYPFIPYQVKLLQRVFDHIRITGYSGKHLAKGERSLLSAFKESSERYADDELGVLIPFSSFYDTVDSFLDPIISCTVKQAEENSHLNHEDCELLKILFLIRHVKLLDSSIDNLLILSVSNIDQDKKKLREGIRESLSRLETETLIHKSGENYLFLTNAEQEINKEIKHIDIDEHLIVEDIYKEIFDNICPGSHRSYQFNKKVDKKEGRKKDEDMTVRFLTQLFDDHYRSADQVSLSGDILSVIDSKDTLLFMFPKENQAVNQINEYLKISRYLKQNISSQNEDEISRILVAKSQEQQKLVVQSKESINEAIRTARVFIDGKEVKLDEKAPKERIRDGLEKLIENVFRKSNYITNEFDTPEDVAKVLAATDLERYGAGESATNRTALKEMLTYISLKNEQDRRIVLKDVKKQFTGKPYGWKSMTVNGLVASLIVSEKINIRYHSENLYQKNEKIAKLLTRKGEEDKLVIEFREKVDKDLILTVKGILRERFDETVIPEKESELFSLARTALEREQAEIRHIRDQQKQEERLPGKTVIAAYDDLLTSLLKHQEPAAMFNSLAASKDELDERHGEAEQARSFFHSQQIAIYRRVLVKIERFERNAQFLDDEQKRNIKRIGAILKTKEPYSLIKELPPLETKTGNAVTIALERLKGEVRGIIKSTKDEIGTELGKYGQLSAEFKKAQLERFSEIENITDGASDCALVESQFRRLRELQANIYEGITEEIERVRQKQFGDDITPIPTPPVRGTRLMNVGPNFSYPKAIKNETDLDNYIRDLRARLKKILEENDIRLS